MNGRRCSAFNGRGGQCLCALVCVMAWFSPAWGQVSGGALNLRDFGAVGDGATNDAPALQAALNALADAGGGTLLVPPGRFAIQTPVTVDFLYRASAVVVQGVGSSSQLILQTGEQADALTLINAESVLLDNLTFVGVPDAATDARIGLYFYQCLQAKLRRCDFYGVRSLVAGGAVIASYWTDLRIEDCAFRGCSGNSAAGVPVIQNENWRGLTVTGTDFFDFGWLNGVYHSKTTVPPWAWIRLGEPVPLDGNGQNRVLLSQVRMDEGAQFGLLCNPNSATSVRASFIQLAGVLMNGSSLSGARGVYVRHADSVRIEQSWFGYATQPRTAIELVGVRHAVLDAVRCEAGMNRIVADVSVGSLVVRESIYAELQSDARVTRVEKDGITAFLRRADGPILAHSLVMWSPFLSGRVGQASADAHASSIAGLSLDGAARAGDYVRVVVPDGQVVPMRSDGAAVIRRGDAVGVSSSLPGRVRSITTDIQIGRAVSSVDAVADALVLVEFFFAPLPAPAPVAPPDVTPPPAPAPVTPPDITPPPLPLSISAVTVTPTSLPASGGAVTVTVLVGGSQPVSSVAVLLTEIVGLSRMVTLNAIGDRVFSGVLPLPANPSKNQARTFGITVIARDAAGGEAIAAGESVTINAKKSGKQQNPKHTRSPRKRLKGGNNP
ncbi:MAG: hypothetical protein NZT92_08135 [Abditibacteriales bacterium]|nr:hypothetical protein [Abditibacteriales bacterium]MDW8365906.1 glycosyl hydrolase family 28-related protein [Abditibacteriales bacterium]